VLDTLAELESGAVTASAIPKILVVQQRLKGGVTYYSMNNRRLWLFKEARARGLLTTVPVRVRAQPTSRRLANKFSPERCALTATFMREADGGADPSTEPDENDYDE
jgi:hypothetical protein